MSKGDVLRSWVREAADRAKNATLASRPVARVRRVVNDALRQRVDVNERAIATALAKTRGMAEVSIQIRNGAVRVEGLGEDRRTISFSLLPLGAFFAPRGAKELRFKVEPPHLASDGRITDAAAVLGGLMAGRLWGPLLRSYDPGPAQVTRDGDLLSIDLRSVPEARRAQATPALAVALDVFEVSQLTAEAGSLSLKLTLPRGLRR